MSSSSGYSLWTWAKDAGGDALAIVVCLALAAFIVLKFPNITKIHANFGLWWVASKCLIFICTSLFTCVNVYSAWTSSPLSSSSLPMAPLQRAWWISLLIWCIGLQTALECVWRIDRWPTLTLHRGGDISSNHKGDGDTAQNNHNSSALLLLWVRRLAFLFYFSYLHHPANRVYHAGWLVILCHHICIPIVMAVHAAFGQKTFRDSGACSTALIIPLWETWQWRQIILIVAHTLGLMDCLMTMITNEQGMRTCWPICLYHTVHLIAACTLLFNKIAQSKEDAAATLALETIKNVPCFGDDEEDDEEDEEEEELMTEGEDADKDATYELQTNTLLSERPTKEEGSLRYRGRSTFNHSSSHNAPLPPAPSACAAAFPAIISAPVAPPHTNTDPRKNNISSLQHESERFPNNQQYASLTADTGITPVPENVSTTQIIAAAATTTAARPIAENKTMYRETQPPYSVASVVSTTRPLPEVRTDIMPLPAHARKQLAVNPTSHLTPHVNIMGGISKPPHIFREGPMKSATIHQPMQHHPPNQNYGGYQGIFLTATSAMTMPGSSNG